MVITESDTILQEYYITRKYKSTFYKEIYITKAERCSRAARGAREQMRRGAGRKSYGDVQASAALWSPRKDPLYTLISYSKDTIVQALGSGHEDQGLSDITRRVHMIKPNGVHIKHICIGKLYCEYKHIWNWNETISKITTGNQLYKLTLPIIEISTSKE